MKNPLYGLQHFVPRCYVSAWCDPTTPNGAYVWAFDITGRTSRRCPPKKLFTETDFYTIPGPEGERDLKLEHGLRDLEDRFAKIRDRKLLKEKQLTAEEGAYLFAFMVAMSFRTSAQRERRRAEWNRVAAGMEEAQMRATTRTRGTPSVRYGIPNRKDTSLSLEDVRSLAESPVQNMLALEMSTYIPLTAGKEMLALRIDDGLGFATSDDPCIWLNERMNAGPPILVELGEFGILMPVSPRQVLFLNPWKSGYGLLRSRSVVDAINRMTVAHAHGDIIASRNEVRSQWFA